MSTELIYQRYTTALDRVTGRGVWMDAGAVRLAMQLAIDDAFAVGMAEQRQQSSGTFQAYASQISRLAEYLVTCGHDADALLDCAPAQIVDRAISLINLAEAQTADVANWLAANTEIPFDGATPLAQAISALTAFSDIIAAQRAALTTLAETRLGLDRRLVAATEEADILREQRAEQGDRIRALETEIRQLREQLTLLQQSEKVANERANELTQTLFQRELEATIQAVPAALAPPNGNGKIAPAPTTKATMPAGLSAVAKEYWEGCERGAHPFRKLPLEIRLEIVQAVLSSLAGDSAVTMAEYDALKPAWMPTASGLPKTFGCTWLDLPTLTPDRIKVAA